ncbi:hypothetical protein JCM17844_00610 [Iodidimonas gelatinilytica]|uniref:Ice-binding protein C-terminal domain-containing protein n=1 Tax=Iodidimonas gelatinilytica TaxID=1236966 RepID=A0A5A7ML85_9PROT|nr:PEP-CTERM sorting domain-containing protein [Iodidimonas gelatinilytica]GEQ96424.1 hypothetical protein JCM17844_00610 [Iodidimonas gelatinilytica]GER00246.1 hypothetical protein JCM17845_08690 [Iodidimonas gelatinilytica]
MKSFSLISVLSLIVAFLPASVQAKPVAVDTSCTTGNATVVDASGVSVGFSSCIGRISGNDAARGGALMLGMLNDDDVFGDLDWVFAGKSDSGDFWADEGEDYGHWGLFAGLAPISGPFVVSFKHGNGFSAYFFDGVTSVKGGWFSLPVTRANGRTNALSHASLFLAQTTSIPEPLSLALFGFGLMGLVVVQRRRLSR